MNNEADVKKRIKALLQQYNCWYTMPIGTGFGHQGVPDFIACVRGFLLGIEAKYGNNTPSALQRRQIAAIKASGGRCLVVNERNLDGLEAALIILTEKGCVE